VELALALVSALLFALGSVLQQRAGAEAPAPGASSGLLLRLARRPVWLAGIGADALGFVAQAAALGVGRLAVVQPLLVTSVVFALPLGARLSRQSVRPRDGAAALAVVAGLAVFLTLTRPSGGRSEAPLSGWVIAGAACLIACAPLAVLGRRGSPPRRAALLAAGAGILFALCAALTKATVDELHRGIGHVLLSWPPYALAAVGYVSMTLNQMALDTGALAPTVATSTALDPIVSVVLGLTLFHESLPAGAGRWALTVLGLGLALAGVVVLALDESPAP
jgi:drug/metabolite transporter (DMT)-like permease